MTTLKVDFLNGTLEVEGSETFVREIYKDFKERLAKEAPPSGERKERGEKGQSPKSLKGETPPKGQKPPSGKKAGKRKEAFQLVKNLDLSSKGSKTSLKEFYAEKLPRTGLERSAVFVYYLQKVAKINNIGVNHIYTCYKDVGKKVPAALRQSLLDTSFTKGWIDTKSMENITITVLGENLVEHDLPPKVSEK